MEVERQNADRHLDETADRRYEARGVLDRPDHQRGRQVVVSETHRHALLTDMCAPGHSLSHPLVVLPHGQDSVVRIAVPSVVGPALTIPPAKLSSLAGVRIPTGRGIRWPVAGHDRTITGSHGRG